MDPVKRLNSFRSGKKIIVPESTVVVPVTASIVTKNHTWYEKKGERQLSPRRMAFLLEAVQDVALPFLWYNGRVNNAIYRLNGQHTLHLFAERPELIREGMVAVVSTFKCLDETELSMVYSALDARISVRSPSEVNGCFSAGHPRLAPYSKSFINLCVSGIRMSVRGVTDHATLSVVQHGELLLKGLDFIDAAHSILGAKTEPTKHMWRAPVVYAMHKSFMLDPEAFAQFWPLVRDGDPKRGSQPDILRDYLIHTALGGTSIKSARSDSRSAMSEKIIRMWNAWRADKPFKKMPPITGKIPTIV